MHPDSRTPESREPESPRMKFHYVKSNGYRVVHLDGVHGGIDPQGRILMNMFVNRIPIPQVVVYPLSEEGGLGDPIPEESISKEGIIREVEFTAIFDINEAKSLAAWLKEKIGYIDMIKEQAGAHEGETE